MNTTWKLASIGAAAAMVGACSHTTTREVVHEQPVVQQTPERVTIVQQPPAPQETMPAPPAQTGYSWLPGHYAYSGGAWVWQPGQWRAGAIAPMPPAIQESIPAAPYATSRWVPGYWSYGSDNSWTWVKGHWQ